MTARAQMATPPKELELKFTAPIPVIAQLSQSDLVSALARGEGRWERSAYEYWDTPERDLASASLSLRKGYESFGVFQTIKRSHDGVTSRDEWVAPLTEETVFPAPTGEGDVDGIVNPCRDQLAIELSIDVDRWTARFPFKNSLLELNADLCKARRNAVDAQASFAEAELELIRGEAADLFSAGRLLLANIDLRLASQSKLDRAAAATSGAMNALPSRRKLAITDGETPSLLLARSLGASAERIIRLQSVIVEERNPAGVHQMRVELRRLRSIVRIFRRACAGQKLRLLAEKARAAARILGATRDWDVFVGETMPRAATSGYASDGFKEIAANAGALRAAKWIDAIAFVDSEAFRQFTLEALACAHLTDWRTSELDETPIADFARAALNKAWKKVLREGRDLAAAPPAARHPLRIELKKLRYSVQLFRTLYDKDRRRDYMSAMSGLQDRFGAINDAVVAQQLADEAVANSGAAAMRAAGFISGFYAARAEAAAKEIDGAWLMFSQMTPFWRDEWNADS